MEQEDGRSSLIDVLKVALKDLADQHCWHLNTPEKNVCISALLSSASRLQ